MTVRVCLLAVLAAAALAAGCGDVKAINGDDAPAVTAPGTTIPYEDGGADGSGADGSAKPDPRGGIAAGHDAGSGPDGGQIVD
jgi:hypothetical protein